MSATHFFGAITWVSKVVMGEWFSQIFIHYRCLNDGILIIKIFYVCSLKWKVAQS